jgi:hypothetical protein
LKIKIKKTNREFVANLFFVGHKTNKGKSKSLFGGFRGQKKDRSIAASLKNIV